MAPTLPYSGSNSSMGLTRTEWKLMRVFIPKTSILGEKIPALSKAWRQKVEVWSSGVTLRDTSWMTEQEYLMEVLKRKSLTKAIIVE